MTEIIPDIAGWIPAVILPVASALQLIEIARKKTAQGVSFVAWILFGLANIGLYVFTEKYFAVQSLIGLLGTALLNFTIAVMALKFRRKDRQHSEGHHG